MIKIKKLKTKFFKNWKNWKNIINKILKKKISTNKRDFIYNIKIYIKKTKNS